MSTHATPFNARRAFGLLQMGIAGVGLLTLLFWRDLIDPMWLFLLAFAPTAVSWVIWPESSGSDTPGHARLLGWLLIAMSLFIAADLAGFL